MKITIATGIYPPDIGGPATYVDHLTKSIVDKGIRVEVVTYGEKQDTPSPFPVNRISRSAPLPWRYLSFFAAAHRAGRGAQLLFAQDPLSSGLPALFAARSLGCPLVLKIVGDTAWEIASEQGATRDTVDAFQSRRYGRVIEWARRAEGYVARSANKIIVPSRYLKRLVNGWGVRAEHIEVVHNSLPEPNTSFPSKDEARRELGLADAVVLFSAGRLVPWKGFALLIGLMPDILVAHPKTRLFIAGSGPYETDLRRSVSELGLDERVVFTGTLDRGSMNAYLAASDLLALASSYEGFSHLLLEAMHAGLPVAASAVGGNGELIENRETGVLIPLDEAAWKTALIELLGNEAMRSELAKRGRERARQFQWESTVDKTLEVLRSTAHPTGRKKGDMGIGRR